MLRSRLLFAAFAPAALLLTAGWQNPAPTQNGTSAQAVAEAAKLDDASLKTMLSGLGYEIKEPGVGTYEIAVETAGLKIPTRIFLSKSKTKIWLSVALMTKESTDKLTREELVAILEKNVDIGPCHFMLEKGWLKMKMSLDNRAITAAVLRSEIDYLSARVSSSKEVWQKS